MLASSEKNVIKIWNTTSDKLTFTLYQETSDFWSLAKLENNLLASAIGFFV